MVSPLPRSRTGPTANAPAEPKGPARAKGRPKKQGDRVGRDEIIRAAGELLQATPTAKLTSAAVARRAGVNPALINYYFKNRSELLAATALDLLKSVWGGQDMGFGQADADLDQRLRHRLGSLLRVLRAKPFLHRLVIEELVHSSSPDARRMFEDLTDGGMAGYRRFVQTGVEKGELRPAEPVFLYLAAIGMCEFFVAGQPILDQALGDKAKGDLAEPYLDFICDMILNGLRPRT